MKKIKIVFNARGSENIGSVRIPFVGIKSAFESFECFVVTSNDFDNYNNYDVAILHGDDDEVFKAREQNPSILIGLAKPHHERVVHSLFTSFSLKSLLYQIRLFTDDNRSNFMVNRNQKLLLSDFLIADSIYLKNTLECEGHNAVYVKLIERFDGIALPLTPKEKSNNKIIFGYHGNAKHFIESQDYIFPALNELSKDYDVVLKVVSNISQMPKNIMCDFDLQYFEYSYPEIFTLLSDVDIGLVPNQIGFRNGMIKTLLTKYGSYFWKTDKAHDLLFRYKQSANAGRAFVFAQIGKPFIACPVPEVVSIFGCIQEDYLPFDGKHWFHSILKLANDENKRIELSEKLLDLMNDNVNIVSEANVLRKYIVDKLNYIDN